jgi:hypothetical protein
MGVRASMKGNINFKQQPPEFDTNLKEDYFKHARQLTFAKNNECLEYPIQLNKEYEYEQKGAF